MDMRLKMLYLVCCFLLFMSQCWSFTVSGIVNFKGASPASLKNGSWLVVKVEDVSLQDVASVTLQKNFIDLSSYDPVKPLSYSITDIPTDSITAHSEVSVSAVLRNGWKSDGDSWIKKGDYLTDSRHVIDFDVKSANFNKDIYLTLYD